MMKPFQPFFRVLICFIFIFVAAGHAQADPYQVMSLRVEKQPTDCQTTLFVTIKNNSSQTTNSGLFVYASQFRVIQNNKKMSTNIGTVRLDNLGAGQSREVSYRFFRERSKTGAYFRFKVGPDSLAYAEKNLPPVTENYHGKFGSLKLDKDTNELTATIFNSGSTSLPRPVIQVLIAAPDTPTDFKGGGGGIVTQCLAPGNHFNVKRTIPPTASGSIIKVALRADEVTLDEKIPGSMTLKKIKPGIKPVYKKQLKYNPDVKTIKK